MSRPKVKVSSCAFDLSMTKLMLAVEFFSSHYLFFSIHRHTKFTRAQVSECELEYTSSSSNGQW